MSKSQDLNLRLPRTWLLAGPPMRALVIASALSLVVAAPSGAGGKLGGAGGMDRQEATTLGGKIGGGMDRHGGIGGGVRDDYATTTGGMGGGVRDDYATPTGGKRGIGPGATASKAGGLAGGIE